MHVRHLPCLAPEQQQAILTIGGQEFFLHGTGTADNTASNPNNHPHDVIQLPDSQQPGSECTVIGSIKQKLSLQVRRMIQIAGSGRLHATACGEQGGHGGMAFGQRCVAASCSATVAPRMTPCSIGDCMFQPCSSGCMTTIRHANSNPTSIVTAQIEGRARLHNNTTQPWPRLLLAMRLTPACLMLLFPQRTLDEGFKNRIKARAEAEEMKHKQRKAVLLDKQVVAGKIRR